MIGDKQKASVLSVQYIPNADPALLRSLSVPDHVRSLGVITSDCDDVSYVAMDEATKKAAVCVVYAKSFYAGSTNASTRLAGEFIGILGGATPAEVSSGVAAAVRCIEQEAHFVSADENDSVVYFAHCISRTGSYLSEQAAVPEGTAMAYLIAPPAEATVGLDAALKAADVSLRVYYGPPTETNFAGGLLTGDQAACLAACQAFSEAVCNVARTPIADLD